MNRKVLLTQNLQGIKMLNQYFFRPISSAPSAGSFSQMLIQALHSGDDNLLHDVLFKVYTDDILKNTIKRIPNNLVGKLMTVVS